MRVLLVITGLTMGGAEKIVAGLADALAARGCEVVLAYLKGPVQVRPARAEVRLVCLGMDSPIGVLRGWFAFRRLLRAFRPDIVHGHMFHAVVLARLAKIAAPRFRLVSTMHTAYDGGRMRALAFRATDRFSDLTTNVSRDAVEAFVAGGAVPRGRMVTVYNGIPVERFRPSPDARAAVRERFSVEDDCRLFLAAGRLNWSKDYPNMFAALARLPAALRYRLLIAGDGELRPQLEAQVRELALADKVRFIGIRDDMPELMAAADVFVLSSVGEAFGLVVAEAMACGCVVVATDASGVREVVGECGFVVPVRDPAALANALVAASSLSAERRAELGSAARRRVVELYSSARAMEEWHALYGRLIAAS